MFIKKNNSDNCNFFMRLALQQAKINLGNTKENPSVGCILTRKGNVISVGHTSINGRPHAEKNAISKSKISVKNSQLYSTLEPCSHFGKTPPCVNTIIRNKISKVYFSVKDPDKRSFNLCKNKLRKNKIKVHNGIMLKKINNFYRSYLKSKKNGLPFVTSKIALSKDFFTINKNRKWITNEFSRGRVHLMRSNHDCIITSINTVIKDNPILNCRIDGIRDLSPARIILDNNLRIPLNSNIVKTSNIHKTIIFFNKKNLKKIKKLKSLKIKTYRLPLNLQGNLDLTQSLLKAKKLGFSRIFLETGKKLFINFLKENLVDDLKIFISNSNLNSVGRNNVKNDLRLLLKNKKFYIEKVNLYGETLKSYIIK